jgi:protein ImuA
MVASLDIARPASRPPTREGAGQESVPRAGTVPWLRAAACPSPARILSLGLPALDAALPGGGLALGRLHEVLAHPGEAGTGFAAALLARIAGREGRMLWCGPAPYGPGLAEFGLDPDRVIFARTGPGPETLWAMEEGLRCPSLAAVLGVVDQLDLTAGRRLQLAAERRGVTAIAMRQERLPAPQAGTARPQPSAATTRWRIGPLPGLAGTARWSVALLRCRGGVPRDFVLEWSHATRDLAVAAAADHGSASSVESGPPQADAAD